jgi:hypothetical protein
MKPKFHKSEKPALKNNKAGNKNQEWVSIIFYFSPFFESEFFAHQQSNYKNIARNLDLVYEGLIRPWRIAQAVPA